MEPIKIEQDELKKAIQSGHFYIQVGNRKFLLFEVEEVNDSDCYEVKDLEEERQIMEALNEDHNPILSEDAIRKMLGN